ncbi:SDR family NAD(P)-dependent oxidoreductase [Leifsonia sp. A12D58]|uniref:SDR family NAD(P)-dependent oxidoreductase n=1 Tax=Leifsonia sp. A12D58 TaxID=3397674 RepID=UPI0039E09BB1
MLLLENKVAIVHGAGGAVGSAVASAFAEAGARVFLAGRTLDSVQDTADAIGTADSVVSEVDALDEQAVERHAAMVAESAGRIDVVFNAISVDPVQGTALIDLRLSDFLAPITSWVSSQFLTSRAAARYMLDQRSGVVLTLSASPARLAIGMTGGFGVASAAVEGLTRTLAAELGPRGVRVTCLRPHRIDETLSVADFPDEDPDEFRKFLKGMTLTGTLPTLADVANTAVFLASDHAAAMTGTVVNLTLGMSGD